ncbi:hypothetical protein DBR13_15475 [Aeromonas sp. HMWF015]|nr:hypothetical protein DBR13_15475 [Aeromonas sp. HMWF015]
MLIFMMDIVLEWLLEMHLELYVFRAFIHWLPTQKPLLIHFLNGCHLPLLRFKKHPMSTQCHLFTFACMESQMGLV